MPRAITVSICGTMKIINKHIVVCAFALVFSSVSAQTNFQKSSFSAPMSKAQHVAAMQLDPTRSTVMLGDVDGDGILTMNDVTELEKAVMDSEYVLNNKEMADMNSDRKVNATDIALLVRELQSTSYGNCNGYEYVDLGLSVKWATCNIGSTLPQHYGTFMAWGETAEKDVYYWDYYRFMTPDYHNWEGCSKYQVADNQKRGVWYDGDTFVGDNIRTLSNDDDAATVLRGSGWRMPTKAEMNELVTKCHWRWINDGYRKGYIVERKGRAIFIPAAGCAYEYAYYGTGSYGYYWSRELTASYTQYAYSLYINSREHSIGFDDRSYGLTIRPVCVK